MADPSLEAMEILGLLEGHIVSDSQLNTYPRGRGRHGSASQYKVQPVIPLTCHTHYCGQCSSALCQIPLVKLCQIILKVTSAPWAILRTVGESVCFFCNRSCGTVSVSSTCLLCCMTQPPLSLHPTPLLCSKAQTLSSELLVLLGHVGIGQPTFLFSSPLFEFALPLPFSSFFCFPPLSLLLPVQAK